MWTEKQLKKFWDEKPKQEKEAYGSYEKWKDGILPEVDENGEEI